MPTQATPALNQAVSDFSSYSDAAGGHDPRPRARAQHRLHEVRTADRAAREDLHDLATQFLGEADLGGRSAARAVGDLAAVADLRDVRIEQWTDDELRAIGDEDARGRRIDDRTDTHDHRRVRLREVARHVEEDAGREVAAVGEFDALRPAVGAGLDHLLADLDVGVIEDGDHALVHHLGQDGHAVLRSHQCLLVRWQRARGTMSRNPCCACDSSAWFAGGGHGGAPSLRAGSARHAAASAFAAAATAAAPDPGR